MSILISPQTWGIWSQFIVSSLPVVTSSLLSSPVLTLLPRQQPYDLMAQHFCCHDPSRIQVLMFSVRHLLREENSKNFSEGQKERSGAQGLSGGDLSGTKFRSKSGSAAWEFQHLYLPEGKDIPVCWSRSSTCKCHIKSSCWQIILIQKLNY